MNGERSFVHQDSQLLEIGSSKKRIHVRSETRIQTVRITLASTCGPVHNDVSESTWIGVKAMETKILLTVEEAADRLSLSRSTMYELLLKGELSSIQVGRARRIPAATLEDYV